MTKIIAKSPGRVGLAKGEFCRLIAAALTEPGTNRTVEEVAQMLDANPRTVKSVKWSLEHPEKAVEFQRRANKKASEKRARAIGRELKKLKKQLEERQRAAISEQLPLTLPEPQPEPQPEMLPPPPALIDINDYMHTMTLEDTAEITKYEGHFTLKPEGKLVDMVNSPPHYTDGGIETIDFIRAKLSRDEYIGYLKGNIIKYSSRLGKKDGMEQDAGKLAWYSQELTNYLKAGA